MTKTRAPFLGPAGGRSSEAQPKLGECPPRRSTQVTKGRKQKVDPYLRFNRLLSLPPEIFNEIASCLLPTDILNLAQSSKFFRGIFMSRTSRQIWRAVMHSVPLLPPCPLELAEPQYISLIYSKMCSSCGATVVRPMDPFLLVRLCDTCCVEQVESRGTEDDDLQFLPQSTEIMKPLYGVVYTLLAEVDKLRVAAESDPGNFANWKKARLEQMQERQKFGYELGAFLDDLESERIAEIGRLKQARWEQIKVRLLEAGWESRVIDGCESSQWQELVHQPAPVTNSIWVALYPELTPFLLESKEETERFDKERRRNHRVRTIENLAMRVKREIPPLVHVKLSSSCAGDHTPGPSNFTFTAASFGLPISHYPGIKTERPFPSMEEFQEWPMIKNVLDEDLLPHEAEERCVIIKDDFYEAVLEWNHNIEKNLVDIWRSDADSDDKCERGANVTVLEDRETQEDVERIEPSTSTSLKQTATTEEKTNLGVTYYTSTPIPRFTVTYAMHDGSTTTKLSDLSPQQQLLLRADTFFKHEETCYAYPDIVSHLAPGYIVDSGRDKGQGDAGGLRRCNNASTVAKQLLSWVGRPNASSAEMEGIGGQLLRDEPNLKLARGWSKLVQCCAQEENRWKQVQDNINAMSMLLRVDPNKYDPVPECARKPSLSTHRNSLKLANSTKSNRIRLVSCVVCEDTYFQGQCFYAFRRGVGCPIQEHLREV
ncbi:hypothetical protein RSOLAG1IB_10335 [Rhizoctonia solani AG-1 IB]|uniref:F-box domain-containing protein n=1 Tax=Thanatephorus cucumeris (strain AG1-IB / isolate 7/3/14) TaxID=1108050 RepID=A0A0B7FWD6_THACB|nr:hypothetical protein RSOLAG1IB_10335 [Rhizoctonia solani AG-1 IB]